MSAASASPEATAFTPPWPLPAESVTSKQLTLVIPREEGGRGVLLGMKKRGFGTGKWNGFGGKVEAHETVVSGARRELVEECCLEVAEADMLKVGTLLFHWRPEEQPVPWEVSVFTCPRWTGAETETEEMRPAWFAESAVPYELMWEDDKHWWPHFLAGKLFRGRFFFQDTDKLVTYELDVVDKL